MEQPLTFLNFTTNLIASYANSIMPHIIQGNLNHLESSF